MITLFFFKGLESRTRHSAKLSLKQMVGGKAQEVWTFSGLQDNALHFKRQTTGDRGRR